jgi:transitional endoplasmic reticulum ATPase
MSNPGVPTQPEITLRVIEASRRDVGRNFARLAASDLLALGVEEGGTVEVIGQARTVAVAMRAGDSGPAANVILIDGITRDNAEVGLDELVVVRPAQCVPASRVTLAPLSGTVLDQCPTLSDYLGQRLTGLPLLVGDMVRVPIFGTNSLDFQVLSCIPDPPAIIQPDTTFDIAEPDDARAHLARLLVYEDIGGLRSEVERLREMVEIPLRQPDVFARLGIKAPRAVLLNGPAGVGKSLMARVVAEAAQARFFSTSGPEIINQYYHENESHLREIFERAVTERPSVIFVDELDRFASTSTLTVGEAEKHIATELLALVDRLERNGRVVVIGSTTDADQVDPTFRRHGRFEREITVQVPTYGDRLEILEIHSRGMPLAEDVDLGQVAALTQGFVGADVSLLCQEAALNALRERMIDDGFSGEPSLEMLAEIQVSMAHFLKALHAVPPSAPEQASIELAEVGWGDVGGLDHLRDQLIETVILPMHSPSLYARVRAYPTRGVLLHGPPGTGKTLLARALAKESGINFIIVKCPQVLAKEAGECERSLRDVFRRAKQLSPSIVFFDDIDAICPAAHTSDVRVRAERLLGQLVAEIDGIEHLRGLVVVAATNRLEMVDRALLHPGRFDLLLEVPLPDSEALTSIFEIHLQDRPLADDVSLSVLVRLAGGFSGADIEVVCQMAAASAIREHLEERPGRPEADVRIAQRHLAAAIAEMCMRRLEEM